MGYCMLVGKMRERVRGLQLGSTYRCPKGGSFLFISLMTFLAERYSQLCNSPSLDRIKRKKVESRDVDRNLYHWISDRLAVNYASEGNIHKINEIAA